MQRQEFINALADAGCTEEQSVEIELLLEHGADQAALKKLKCCRCEQLGIVHEEQRKIDLYDYLIDEVRNSSK